MRELFALKEKEKCEETSEVGRRWKNIWKHFWWLTRHPRFLLQGSRWISTRVSPSFGLCYAFNYLFPFSGVHANQMSTEWLHPNLGRCCFDINMREVLPFTKITLHMYFAWIIPFTHSNFYHLPSNYGLFLQSTRPSYVAIWHIWALVDISQINMRAQVHTLYWILDINLVGRTFRLRSNLIWYNLSVLICPLVQRNEREK